MTVEYNENNKSCCVICGKEHKEGNGVKRFFCALLSVCLLGCGLGVAQAEGTAMDVYERNVQALTESMGTFFEEQYGEGDKVAPYEETLRITMATPYNTTTENAMAEWNQLYGETLYDNRYTDAILRSLNIDVEYAWMAKDGTDYDTQLRLAMTSNELPDIFLVRNQADLLQLAEVGLIWDLTDLFETCGAQIDRKAWASDGGALMQMATYEGRVYGMPSGVSDTDTFSYLWLRKDWMQKLGLAAPKTMEDLKAIMRAFMKADLDANGKDDTYGMLIDKDLYYATRGLFSAYGAYPEFWVEDEGGAIVWGGVSENCKDALAYLNGLYKEGFLDPEFIAQTNADAQELVLNGRCGVLYGGHWFGHVAGDLHEMDDESDWVCYTLPTATGDAVRSPLTPCKRGWVVVNKNFDHPEAAFKIRALCTVVNQDPNVDGSWWWFDKSTSQWLEPVQANVSAWDNLDTYLNLRDCYQAGGDTSLLKGKAITYWANLHGDAQWEWELMFGPDAGTPMTVLEEAVNQDLVFYDAFLGAQSEYMLDRWSTIRDEQLIAFTKMIIGEADIETGFASWVETFDKMGGERITDEVNAWYKAAHE